MEIPPKIPATQLSISNSVFERSKCWVKQSALRSEQLDVPHVINQSNSVHAAYYTSSFKIKELVNKADS